jgi:alkylation response protein AidB-like acyl-CoA dehydrogenase
MNDRERDPGVAGVQADDSNTLLRDAIAAAPVAIGDDLAQLRSLARGFLARERLPDPRVRNHDPAAFREPWARLAKTQGWPGFLIGEEHGGAGLGFAEVAVVIGECGRLLAFPELVTTGVLAVTLLNGCDAAVKDKYLPGIASGGLNVAVAGGLTTTGADSPVVYAKNLPHGQVQLSGEALFVADAICSDLFLVRVDNGRGSWLYAVPTESNGVVTEELDTLDLTRPLAKVTLSGSTASLLCEGARLSRVWESTRLLTMVALAMEQLGGADRSLESILSYVSTREQFGRPIGSFQAVKHRCADLFVELQAAHSAVEFAVWAADRAHPCITMAASIAKAAASEAFSRIAGEAIQLHGGIGFSWEHEAHLYFRRARADEVLLGNSSWHRAKIARMLGLSESENRTGASGVGRPFAQSAASARSDGRPLRDVGLPGGGSAVGGRS